MSKFLIGVLLGLPFLAWPQQASIAPDFDHLTTGDGLSQGMINAILQDQRGFLWIGTKDGLNRYDGYQFKVFRKDPFDTTTLSDNYIETLFEDQYGVLWIGTEEGLNRYDPRLGRFTRFISNPNDPTTLNSSEISCIAEAKPEGPDQPQVLWIGTRKGLNRLEVSDPQSEHPAVSINRISSLSEDRAPLSDQTIRSLIVDHRGNLWVSTNDQLFRTTGPYVPSKPVRFEKIASSDVPRGDLPYNKSCTFFLDPSGSLWIGSGNAITRVQPDGSGALSFQSSFFPDGYQMSRVDNLARDRQGNFWIIDNNGPSWEFHIRNLDFERLDSRYAQFTTAYSCTKVFFDRCGNIWLGTNGFGLLKYNLRKDRFHSYTRFQVADNPPQTSYVYGFLPTANGEGVIASMDRFYALDARREKLVPADLPLIGQPGLEWRALAGGKYFIFRLKKKEYQVFDPHTGETTLIRKAPANRALSSETVVETPGGDIYFIEFEFAGPNTEDRFFLVRYNTETRTTTEQLLADISSRKFSRTFGKTAVDQRGWLWFTNRDGLVRYDPADHSQATYQHDPADPHSLGSSNIKVALPDPIKPERYLWVGTNGGGLNRLDRESGKFIHYTQEDGLPNSVIYGILPDAHGNLWVSTNQGISRVQLNEERDAIHFHNYNRDDGLPGDEFNTNAYYKNEKGELFFGGIDGFVWFNPDSLAGNSGPPAVAITDFQIDYRSVSPLDPASPLDRPVTETKQIVLRYDQDAFAFEFAALDFSTPSKNRYAYFLENFDDGWQEGGAIRRAVYTNIPPGEYRFRVKASNSDGIWNETGAAITIIIRPPWWRTWWAYSIFGAGAIGLLWLIRKSELQRRNLRNQAGIERAKAEEKRKQAETVEAQARELTIAFEELKHKNEEIIAAQQKLIVQDKLATLGQLIAGIAHEIKNPLNFVTNFSEVSVELADELEEELDKYRDAISSDDFDNWKEILKDIRENMATTRENGQRALGIIRNLMDLSRGTEDAFRPVDLHQLLDENIKLAYHGYRAVAPSFNVAIEKKYASDLPQVEAIPADLGRVLLNILNNACYAVHQKQQAGTTTGYTPTLTISTRRENGEVSIHIRDNGPGMPAAIREKIFTPFFTTKPSGEGNTGLGLSISHDIVVDKHGGRLEVNSEPGEFTEFVITIPVKSEGRRVKSEE